MAGYYNIDDGFGNQITVGLQPHQARRVAERIANERGESVFLYKAGEDESEEIAPSKTSKKPSHHHATKKSPAQLDREIAEALANPAVKCPSPEHPLYPELRHIRQVAHDTSWAASQLAKDAEAAFRSGDCAKAATMLEAAKRVIAKERRKKPSRAL